MTKTEKNEILSMIETLDESETKTKLTDYVNNAEIDIDEVETLGTERDNYKQQAEDFKNKYEDLKEKYVKRIITPSGNKIEYEKEKEEEIPQIFEEEEIVK